MFKKVDPKQSFPKMEEEILKYWEDNKIFEKSVANREGAPQYSFYDGPPFATGLPHYGHLVGSIMKDAVPRYWTMKGFQVERRWGWDCHGLPIENIAEKELGIKHKKDIEEMGVAKFNEFCRSKVMEYAAEWEKVIPRIGRWADMKHAYKTMDRDYMESIWRVFKELWDKGLIYESYRSMHICPRCETTLSQQEVAEGYRDVKDLSVTAEFELVDEPGTFVLAWTTTPWTLPGNAALAVGSDVEYVVIEKKDEGSGPLVRFILAKSLLEKHFGVEGYELIAVIKGSQLVGKSYKPLFDYYSKDESLENRESGWKIYAADFVTTEDGTGVVHIAPAFGEDDMNLGKEMNLPFIQHVKMDGMMKDEVTDFAGMPVKSLENPQACDVEIIKYLAKNGTLFAKEKYEHPYPHCWRCDTPLLNYATSSWFVSVTKVKDRALKLAKDIHWSPEHIKEGRFGKWLEGARDWSISRQRYWASVMPIWKCECGELRVFGSVAELETASGKKIEDLHKHVVDGIEVPCEKCRETMQRIPDVLDTWFDSGSMPYAQAHYPFENAEKFKGSFPAQYIAEGIDQTRAWFYYLHVLGTILQDKPAFQNVIVNGIVLAEDGKKMSKKLRNYPDPMAVVEKHGADALRLYLLSSPIVAAENLNFSEKELVESTKNLFRMLWNSYSFFVTYANIDGWKPRSEEQGVGSNEQGNILDRWILSELQVLIRDVNSSMESYDLMKATRAFSPFVDNLSNWYVRRSRDRFWKNENDSDKEGAYATLHFVLVELAKLLAPFAPFIAEEIYRGLTGKESVHLADWPVADEKLIDIELSHQMVQTREIITFVLRLRSDEKSRSLAKRETNVRQPLSTLAISKLLGNEMLEIIKDEVNVKEVVIKSADDIQSLDNQVWVKRGVVVSTLILKRLIGGAVDETPKQKPNNDDGFWVALNIFITEDLKLKGEMNEINRAIQDGRKKAGFNVEDRIVLGYQGKEKVFEKFGDEIAKKVLATSVTNGNLADAEYMEAVDIDGQAFTFWLKRIG